MQQRYIRRLRENVDGGDSEYAVEWVTRSIVVYVLQHKIRLSWALRQVSTAEMNRANATAEILPARSCADPQKYYTASAGASCQVA